MEKIMLFDSVGKLECVPPLPSLGHQFYPLMENVTLCLLHSQLVREDTYGIV
jgi:hypothetical protein